MKQASLKRNMNVKKTRKQVFLEQMEQVVPWAALVELIAPYYPEGKTGRPPFFLQTMLRIHFMQQWFTLSDPGMEEAFFDTPLYREFSQLEEFGRLPDESTILRFRHRLEKHKLAEQILVVVNEILVARGLLLKTGTVVDATLIAAPSSTKNKDHKRDPDMHSSKKGEQMYFGMKAHIGADAESGLVHAVRGTSGNVHDVTEGNSLLHGQEVVAFGDAGYSTLENHRNGALQREGLDHAVKVAPAGHHFGRIPLQPGLARGYIGAGHCQHNHQAAPKTRAYRWTIHIGQGSRPTTCCKYTPKASRARQARHT